MKKGLYAGSFDPYTNGHHAIVKKAAALLDELIVLIGVNTAKKRSFDAEKMAAAIREALAEEKIENAEVVVYDGLVADYCREEGVKYYIRGLRNNMDYNYEENIAQINHLINPGLETIYMRAEDTAISSSMVRELLAFGKDVSAYVPKPIESAVNCCRADHT